MTSKPTARERYQKIKDDHDKVIQPEPMIGFLLALVEAAIEQASIFSRNSKCYKLENGNIQMYFEPVDSNMVWNEVEQRMSEEKSK